MAAKASPVLTQCQPPGGLLCLSIKRPWLEGSGASPIPGFTEGLVWWGNQLRAERGIVDSLVKTDADNKATVRDTHPRL